MMSGIKYRKILCFILLSGICASASAYTERNIIEKNAGSRDRVAESVIADRSWITVPGYADRQGWDEFLGEPLKTMLIAEGEKLLDYEWHLITASDYLEYGRSGNIEVMEKPYFENRRNINILMLAELAEGKGRFIGKLLDGVFYSCEMTTWAVSAHLKYQNPKCLLPDYRRPLFDLAAGDYASMLAWTYYFFREEFDKIDPVISIRLREVLQERALDAYMENDEWWMAKKDYAPGDVINNWNPWCNSNALQCFLLLEDDPEVLTEAIWRSIKSVDKFLNFVHSDGACEEGATYWTHAAGKVLDYLQLLEAGTGGKVSVLHEPLIRKMGEYISRSWIGDGWVVNFADASPRYKGEPHLIYRYGKAVGSSEMTGFAALLMKEHPVSIPLDRGDTYRALQAIAADRELRSAEASHEIHGAVWYPETEVCYFSGGKGMFAAMKGGHNNESHNHNDVGSFILYLDAEPVFIDAGVGTYTRQTFSSERYSIWTMQSGYHNIPEINGVQQHFGYEYRPSEVVCDPERRRFSLDISGAYPQQSSAKRWVRSYSMSDGRFSVEDSFSIDSPSASNRVIFMTPGQVDFPDAGKAEIAAGEKSVVLEYPSYLTAEVEEITLDDPKLSGVWGSSIRRIVLTDKEIRKKGIYRFLIYESYNKTEKL